jgi:hypothetical protein
MTCCQTTCIGIYNTTRRSTTPNMVRLITHNMLTCHVRECARARALQLQLQLSLEGLSPSIPGDAIRLSRVVTTVGPLLPSPIYLDTDDRR